MPYVSNEERNRLGLHGWGSDVPQHVLDEALAAADHPVACGITAEPSPVAAPKRARSRRGQFLADDPTTQGVNEAFVEG